MRAEYEHEAEARAAEVKESGQRQETWARGEPLASKKMSPKESEEEDKKPPTGKSGFSRRSITVY
jgi:hypothetical protein